VSGTGNFLQTFYVSAPVTSGSIYTFQFIPTQGGGLPDPYGVQVENPGTYAAGEMRITDPSGTYPTGFDMVFKTFVTIYTATSPVEDFTTSVSIWPNPFSINTTLTTRDLLSKATLRIYNVCGQLVKCIDNISGNEIRIGRDNLESGIYFIRLEQAGRIITTEKLVVE
jgi:hypothetical protein